jgi:hypothetical protein
VRLSDLVTVMSMEGPDEFHFTSRVFEVLMSSLEAAGARARDPNRMAWLAEFVAQRRAEIYVLWRYHDSDRLRSS